MPHVYKMPLLYSLNNNSYTDFFDVELEEILSKYSFFVSNSVKQGCIYSDYIYAKLKQEQLTVRVFSFGTQFHFICCIIRDNIRYYIDNETKSGFGVVYLRIEGETQNHDLSILKLFYNSEQYKAYEKATEETFQIDDPNPSKYKFSIKTKRLIIPDIIKKFFSVEEFITPHIIDINGIRFVNEINHYTPHHTIPSLKSKINADEGKYITIDDSLIDGHVFVSSAVISFDDYKCFTLSPGYNEVFNQFFTFMKRKIKTVSDIIELLKLCLLIPDFKLQTYKSTSVEGNYSSDCATEFRGGSRKKTNKRKINKRNSKNSKRNLKKNSKNSKRNSKRNSKNSKRKH